MDNNKEMISTIVSQKLKLEKVSELETFKNKVDSMLITHEIRIKNSLDEIDKIKTKYDKIVSDNLYVTGFVGSSCQFRNLSEYISYNIAEVSRLKMEKEQLKKEIKEIKGKFEGMMKSMINMNDNTAKLCNKYTDSKQIYFQNLLESAKEELNQKSLDMRVMTQKFQKESEEQLNQMKQDIKTMKKTEENLNNIINDNFYICEKQHEEIKKSIDEENNSIVNNKSKIEKLNEKIQEIEPKIKLVDVLNSKVSKMFDTVKEISYHRSALSRKNNQLTQSVQSPDPRKLRRKNSNSALLKINGNNDIVKNLMNNNDNNDKKTAKSKLIKSVRFPVVKNLNLNRITAASVDELNKSKKKEEKNQELKKSTFFDDNPKTSRENNKSLINNESTKEKEKEIENEILKDKEREKEKDKEPEKEKEKEETKVKPSILKNANLTNAIQTLPMISIEGKNSSKNIILKPIETEDSTEINDHQRNNNVLSTTNNENQFQTNPNLSKLKKIGLEMKHEEKGCKFVSLKLSTDNSKEATSISKRPPKAKYDIVNSLINDYRAKLFKKMHSPEQIYEMNNEILEMPKRVTQAFGRTAYTFYFNKDNMGLNTQKKGNINLKKPLKTETENKNKK